MHTIRSGTPGITTNALHNRRTGRRQAVQITHKGLRRSTSGIMKKDSGTLVTLLRSMPQSTPSASSRSLSEEHATFEIQTDVRDPHDVIHRC